MSKLVWNVLEMFGSLATKCIKTVCQKNDKYRNVILKLFVLHKATNDVQNLLELFLLRSDGEQNFSFKCFERICHKS